MKEYKLGNGAIIKTDRAPTPVKEWLDEGKRRFGDVRNWRFKCPMCGKEYSVQEFVDGNPDGCNWCAYGFLGTAGKGRLIEAEDGTVVEVFRFAGEEAPND